MALRMRRILVAIGDWHRPPRAQLRKAVELARLYNARVELFHALTFPFGNSVPTGTAALYAASHLEALTKRAQQRLGSLAKSPLLADLQVTTHVTSDYPIHEAIIRRAMSTSVDLVVIGIHRHSAAARLFLTNTDWELIRQCPCPLLLVKSTRRYARSAVLTAVDPFHTHAKPANLDTRLLQAGAEIARQVQASLHLFHAYLPWVNLVPMPGAPFPIDPSPEVEAAHRQLILGKLSPLAKRFGITPRATHLSMGPVPEELAATVRRIHAAMVVMGAVSRSALRRLFIGHTAEAVLDKLPCDILLIKPKTFRTTVSLRGSKQ